MYDMLTGAVSEHFETFKLRNYELARCDVTIKLCLDIMTVRVCVVKLWQQVEEREQNLFR